MGKDVKMLSNQFTCIFIPFEACLEWDTIICAIEVKRYVNNKLENYFKQMIVIPVYPKIKDVQQIILTHIGVSIKYHPYLKEKLEALYNDVIMPQINSTDFISLT